MEDRSGVEGSDGVTLILKLYSRLHPFGVGLESSTRTVNPYYRLNFVNLIIESRHQSHSSQDPIKTRNIR